MSETLAGTIIAAVIAALISLLGLIISKETKVSEFRQAWIDSLRSEIAAVVTHARAMHGATFEKPTLWRTLRDDFVGLNEAWAKVKLRLNTKKSEQIDVLEALKEHESIFQPETRDFARLDSTEEKLLAATQIVLKKEWERVKSGELTYKVAKMLAGALLLLGLIALLFSRCFVPSKGNSGIYHVVERTDEYVDAQGRTASEQLFDHEVVHFVFEFSNRKIYAQCDLTTLNKIDPTATCALRPMRDYDCRVATNAGKNVATPLSDLICNDADGHKVYLYVSKQE